MNPATDPHGPGPKSTPAYADGRLFTLGMTGIVSAFDADGGELLWQVPGRDVEPLYHTAMSPVVDGDLVIFHVGGHDDGALTAFDTASGDVRWSWAGDGPAYGSPRVMEIEGVRQVVTYTQANVIGVEVQTGELLWRRAFTTEYDTTSQTPVRYGDLLLQTGRGGGITAYRVLREGDAWTTEDVWHTSEVALHMTNGVVADGVLFGLSYLNSGQYFGLDLESGEVLWTGNPRQAENASILRSGNTFLSLQEDAELLVVSASRTGLDVVKSYEVADSVTWTQPTLVGNRLYVKDIATLTLWTLD
jgi:outer membrane protein assembly factor BamB